MTNKFSKVLTAIFLVLGLISSTGIADKSGASIETDHSIYLPLILNKYPFTPPAPVLSPIDNTDGDGTFTVNWSSSEGATMYTLEEDDNDAFSSPANVYQGSAVSKDITGKTTGTYYYRVKAANDYAESDWSNTQSVQVTLVVSECPQTGLWRGVTSQKRSISFKVEDQPQCQIVDDSLVASWQTNCGEGYTIFYVPFPIIENSFDASGISEILIGLQGTFSSSSLAQGTFDVFYTLITPYYRECSGSETWTAHPLHGVQGIVQAVYVQTDNKILLGGDFSSINYNQRLNLARLNPDGSLDETFHPELNSYVSVITQQSDDKILVGGYFSEVDGQTRNGIVRLNLDGSLDESFNPDLAGTQYNARIFDIQVLADGDILIGGQFSYLIDQNTYYYTARLNPDGSIDQSFSVSFDYTSWNNEYVNTLALFDDQVYIGGAFTVEKEIGDMWIERENLARLDMASGDLDENFEPALPDGSIWEVRALEVQPIDGKIIILQGVKVSRLLTSGELDSIFIDFYSGGPVTVGIKNDGHILVGGYFDNFLIEFLPDGSQNMDFIPDVNNNVQALALQSDGKIVLGGEFIVVGGLPRDGIARINADGTVDASFDPGP